MLATATTSTTSFCMMARESSSAYQCSANSEPRRASLRVYMPVCLPESAGALCLHVFAACPLITMPHRSHTDWPTLPARLRVEHVLRCGTEERQARAESALGG